MDLLKGYLVGNFRSFRETQRIGPLTKVNLFVGQNNAGKSNALTYAARYLAAASSKRRRDVRMNTVSGHDIPLGSASDTVAFGLALDLPRALDAVRAKVSGISDDQLSGLAAVFSSRAFRLTDDDLIWFTYVPENVGPDAYGISIDPNQMTSALDDVPGSRANASSIAQQHLGEWGGGANDDFKRIVDRTIEELDLVPSVESIEAFRRIEPGDSFAGYSGAGLIAGLGRLQEPDAADSDDRTKFEAINDFLRTVLDDPTAVLRIPHHRQTINVQLGGRLLPLAHLGTGIHQVTIIAAACTLLEDRLVSVEEPEIHLHPLLQRKLLSYLAANTSNQYLIATHSAHLLDSNVASVFHVTNETGTVVRRAVGPTELAAICADLGYRPSDLLQANAVVWVEGPSDRIYVRYWLERIDPELVEGIHYSIMFYGGRLLSHLSAHDPQVDDFISLRRLNRHIAIVIDSDKKAAHAKINATKQRVRSEFDVGAGHAWITDSRVIENYIPSHLLVAAVKAVHRGISISWAGDRWADPLVPDGSSSALDKVAIAREVVAVWKASGEPLGAQLESRVAKVARFVRDANGFPPLVKA